ncbi:MAG: cadherin repeat domain-containing protein, partial [Pseudomonadales bacterium]|nr:cadherin repeat domain-containing protein [Pseudomonadales bacterium]
VNITVTPFDEQPLSTQNTTTNRAPVWYLSKNDSRSILISSVFMDPEGAPVYFNSAAASTDVYVCDSNEAGDRAPAISTIGDNAYASALDSVATPTVAAATGTARTACTVSNEADRNGIPGSAGNRVVTTRKVGPILHITGVLDDPNTDLVDRPKGTYTAHVLFRVWSGPADGPLVSRDWSEATVHVKVGANNLPQFAGGATGYTAEMPESNEGTGTAFTTAWLAGDLDEGGVNNDTLTYSLEGQFQIERRGYMAVSRAGGLVGVNDPSAAGLSLWGNGIDYETAQSFTVNLQVTDHWSDPISVPITVTVNNVNELEFAKDGPEYGERSDENL